MTKAFLTGVLGTMALAVLAAVPVQAEQPQQPQAYVVLVGISKYEDKQILPRPHAEDDVKALYDLFVDKERLGVDAGHMRLLLGSADDKRSSKPATHDNIIQALHWATSKARRDDHPAGSGSHQSPSLRTRCAGPGRRR